MVWGLFRVIVGVFLEIRECFWTICRVFWAVSLHKLPKSFPQVYPQSYPQDVYML